MGKIWYKPFNIEEVNHRNHQTLSSYLQITCIEIGEDYLKGQMKVTQKHMQPNGIMNGGASCVFAETLASTAANYCIDQEKFICVGLSLTTNHIKPAFPGYLFALAKPEHLGKTTQVWSIDITNEERKKISLNRLTLAIVKKH